MARTYLFQPFLAVRRTSLGRKQPLDLGLDRYSRNTQQPAIYLD